MPNRFTLIRHGQTDWNVAGKWQGHAFVGLNSEGHRQAMKVADALVGTDATGIYTSDLPRARQTAEYIGDKIHVPVITDERLREIHLGDWQGLTAEEVEEWDSVRLAVVRSGDVNVKRPHGESQYDVGMRMLSLIEEVQNTRDDSHVIFVSHGGTIRITLMALNLLHPWHGHIDNTSRTILTFDSQENRWSIESYNIVTHLLNPAPTLPGEQ